MPWINYFWGVLIRSYKELEERVANLDAGKGQKSQLVIQTIEKKWKPFSISEIEEECLGISRELIRNVIREMKDQGKLIPKGKGRGAKWIVKRN
jgi:biotin operon repressor